MSDALQVARAGLEAFNAHDEERIRASYAPDAVFEGPGGESLTGPDAITASAMRWLNAFPDGRVNVGTEIAAGEWVVFRFTFEGTHEKTLSGPEGDIPPTNKRLAARGVQLMRIVGGKVAEEHLHYDRMDVMQQLGLVPETAAAAS